MLLFNLAQGFRKIWPLPYSKMGGKGLLSLRQWGIVYLDFFKKLKVEKNLICIPFARLIAKLLFLGV